MKYKNIRDVSRADCGIGPCPRIYEAECVFAARPGVHKKPEDKEVYLIIGRKLSAEEVEEAGLSGKVASTEAVTEVPRRIINERKH